MDLRKADQVFEFMLDLLEENGSAFGQQMSEAISSCINEHRNAKLSGIIHLLSREDLSDSTLGYPTRLGLIKYAQNLYMKLFFEPRHLKFLKQVNQVAVQINMTRIHV